MVTWWLTIEIHSAAPVFCCDWWNKISVLYFEGCKESAVSTYNITEAMNSLSDGVLFWFVLICSFLFNDALQTTFFIIRIHRKCPNSRCRVRYVIVKHNEQVKNSFKSLLLTAHFHGCSPNNLLCWILMALIWVVRTNLTIIYIFRWFAILYNDSWKSFVIFLLDGREYDATGMVSYGE